MALIFDTTGDVIIPTWTATGDFSISGVAEYESQTSIILGNNANNVMFLATTGGSTVRLKFNSTLLNVVVTGVTDNEILNYTISRVGSDITLTVNGFTGTATNSGSLVFDRIGSYNGGISPNRNAMRDILTMDNGASDVRTYDFELSTGTTLLDTTAPADDGTLQNFTTGGFEGSNGGAGNVAPTVTMPANQTGIAAGTLVTLIASDADSDGTVASRQWTEISSTGVALTGATTNTLSFNAPSTGADQTLTFQYVVTDNEGATSTPAQVTVGVLAVAAGSPSIAIVQPTAANSARSWDENQNATFPIELNINNLPTDAIVEVSQDGGATYTALNATSTSSVSENLVVNGQKNVIFRLDTDPTVTASIQLTAGFAILAWGQSNEKGQGGGGLNDGITYSGPTPLMFQLGEFKTLEDNTVYDEALNFTSTWPRIAQLYSAAGIPLILCNVAVGGTSVNAWLKATGIHYPRISEGVAAMNGANMCTCLIGETDARSSNTLEEMTTKYGQMVDDVFTDFGIPTYITDFPLQNGAGSTRILAAFEAVILNNPNAFAGGDLQQVDIAQPATTDGLHLQTFAQLSQAAEIRYAAFNAINSTITVTGTPDGIQYLFLVNPLTGFVAFNGNANFVGGSASVALSADVGVTLKGFVDDGSTTNPVGGRVLKVV